MRRKAELVKRRDGLEAKPAVDQEARVAGEGRRVAGDRDDERQRARGEFARLRLRPGARRIEQDAVEGGELRGAAAGGGTGRASRRRSCAGPAPRPRRARAHAMAAASESAAKTSRRRARRSAKAPAPQKRSATFFAPSNASSANAASRSSPASVACRKPPGGSVTSASPKATRGGRRSIDERAVIGEAREVEPLGGAHELAGLGQFERPRAAQVDVEPIERRGHADVERLAEAPQIAGQRARGLDRARHRRREQRAGVDRDDVVRARAHEADFVRARHAESARERSRAAARRHARRSAGRRPRSRRRRASAPRPRGRASSRDRALAPCAAPRSRRRCRTSGRRALPARGSGSTISTSSALRPASRTRARSPGKRAGNGCAVCRDAVAARRRGRRSSRSSDASVMARRDQEFPGAGAAEQRRGDEAEDAPALRLDRRRARRRMRARAPPRS